ncbi:MAG TPA: S8/S53 family peptidase, partial [Chitinophagales bacterium]
FTQTHGMDYIELDEPIAMSLDSARKTTHVDSVHNGIELPQPYTGNGVIVGVVDVGFDYTHPTFFDTTRQTYRIKRVWEEHKNGTPPSNFSYGNEITDSTLIQTAKTDDSLNVHGTHVLGIAAGSGRGSGTATLLNSKYRGVAYQSDIVLASIMPDSLQWENTGVSDVIDGMNYVYLYASSVGKPAVINLSWGSPVGPRDGSSLFSQAVDAMTGAGKIFVVSAGNDGDVNLHVRKTFSPTDTIVKTFVTFQDTAHTNTWLDLWGETGKTMCAKISLYNNGENASTNFVCLDNQVHEFSLRGTDGDTCFVTITTSTSEFNGKPRIYFGIGSATTDSIVVTISSQSGTVDLWNGYVQKGEGFFGALENYGYAWATAGDAEHTTSDWVSTRSAISVGAYAARTSFRTIGGMSYGFSGYAVRGDLVPFSSHGPTTDGRVVPTITAPGLAVISSLSSFYHDLLPGGADYGTTVVSKTYDSINAKYYYYGQFSGTSMSGPMTSGIVALMLEAHPSITPTQVAQILAQTAIIDTFTGALPAEGTNLWGHGKINAYQAVVAASALPAGLVDVNEKWLNCILFPNPTNSKFTLEYTSAKNENAQVEFYDINGRKLLADNWNVTPTTNRKTIDVSAFSAGVYFVKLSSASGSWASKVVVE